MFKDRVKQVLLIGLSIIALFYFIEWITPNFSLANSMRNSALIVFRWPINILSKVYIGATNLGDIFKLSSIKQENLDLTAQNLQLEQENENLQEYQILVDKDQELAQFFPTLQTLPVESRGYFQEGGRSYFLIDKGSDDGVVLDKGVVWGKYLVGKVTEVYPKTAVVDTILSKNLIINICVASNRESGLGVAQGTIANGMEVSGFPSNINVLSGETILTSGLGGILPPNLIVGKVIEKISSQSEATQRFLVEPFLDFSGLSFLQVIKN
jgi:rod shape-determining protein MreC